MSTTSRPACVANFADSLDAGGVGDLAGRSSPLGRALGLVRLGIHHEILQPGHRTSFPHAESHEEEFVYVLSGLPSVWLNGNVFDLVAGDAVGFPAGTDDAHTFLNNSNDDAHLLVVGEATKPENRVYYPLDPERQAEMLVKGLS